MKVRNALILAAGRGRRLGGASGGLPKSLIDVGGRTTIERQCDALAHVGVSHTSVVVGYRQDLFRERLSAQPGVSFVENPRYESTDLLESFRLGMDALGDGGWQLLADTLFHPSFLDRMAACPADLVLGLDRHPCGEEEMKLRLDGRRPVQMSKEQDPARADGEFVGVCLLRGAGLDRLRSVVHQLHREGDVAHLYEGAFQRLMDLDDPGLAVVDLTGEPWIEVDFPEDLERARAMFG